MPPGIRNRFLCTNDQKARRCNGRGYAPECFGKHLFRVIGQDAVVIEGIYMKKAWFDEKIFPLLLDATCSLKSFRRQRAKVVPQARGRVLEIGIGTGLNVPFYDPGRVSLIIGVDPSEPIHRLARRRGKTSAVPVELLAVPAERMPFADDFFDSAVCTYTLCSVSDPSAALNEIRRVLKPGGTLLFSEHGLCPEKHVAKWQSRLQPYWERLSGGCHLDRNIPFLLAQNGFESRISEGYVIRPRIVGYTYWGEAIAR